MKTKFLAFLDGAMLVAVIAFMAVSCSQFEQKDVAKTLTPSVEVTNCSASQRAMMRLTVLPEECPSNVARPLVLEFSIDGKAENLVQIPGGNLTPMEEKDWQGFKARFQSGSTMYFSLWKSYVPTIYFLMPQLPAGSHTITINLKDVDNSYGAAGTCSGTWNVK